MELVKSFKLELPFAKKAKPASAVGLDIGSYAIKCVEVSRTEGQAILKQACYEPLPNSTKDALLMTLRRLLQSFSPPPKTVRVAVAGPSVLIRRISLPALTPSELKGAIRFEAERHIPFSIHECVLDFQVLGQAPDHKSMNVLLAVAKRDFIEERFRLLAEAGLYPEVMDADIFCLANAYEALSNGGPKTYGLLNVGHGLSSFAIIYDGIAFFFRELSFGGAGITKAIQELKGVDENQADRLKKTRGAEEPDLLKQATQKGFEPLADELKLSIDYFENEIGEELKTLFLSGGGALSAGAGEALAAELGKEVIVWDGVKRMAIAPEKVSAQFLEDHYLEFSVACGLALRGLGKSK
ncbi:MAG: type IV pilus assembly protein PilM [Candidatus Omnitrophica bacterium]|nr:type IV pilus assembly protein PilM [Candidatus Omnitrophota bacterium]